MLKLRTKTPFSVPYKRTTKPVIIRLIVDDIKFDVNNAVVNGYYYYLDEDDNNNVVKLDTFTTTISWTVINQTEIYVLQPITTPNLSDVITQRLREFTFLQLEIENGKNYGTNSTDWELDI